MEKMGMTYVSEKQVDGRRLVVYGFPEDVPDGFGG
jgi:hypothetical protein